MTKYYFILIMQGHKCRLVTEGKIVGLHFVIGHVLLRNCLLKHVIERKAEGRLDMAGGRRRRCKQLLDDFKEKRGSQKLIEIALDCAVWRTHFGKAVNLSYDRLQDERTLLHLLIEVGVEMFRVFEEKERKKLVIGQPKFGSVRHNTGAIMR